VKLEVRDLKGQYLQRAFFVTVFLGAVGILSMASTESAHAGALTVNNAASSGPMTLRHAIESANGNLGPDVINFDPSVFPPGNPSTIALADPLPEINASDGITIDGSGAGVIIDGSALGDAAAGFFVNSGGDGLSGVSLHNLTVRGFPGHGIVICGGDLPGCEQNLGDVELAGVVALDNGEDGLRIAGERVMDVTVQNCGFNGNGAYGVYLESQLDASNIQIHDCTADHNASWGVFATSEQSLVDFSLVDSSVSDNVGIGAYLESVEETTRPTIDNVDALGNSQMGIGFSAAQPLTDLTFTDSNVDGNGSTNGNGLGTEVLALQIIDATITGNSFSNNLAANPVGGVGFQIYSQIERPSGLVITGNTMNDNVGPGISIITDTPGNEPVDQNMISENEISGNTGDGVFVQDSRRVTISRNSIFGNDRLGINLRQVGQEPPGGVTPNDPGDDDEGSNDLLNFPVLTGISGDSVQGTACTGCTVELFESDGDPSGHGEGRTFISDVTAAGNGTFSISVSGLCAGDLVTATATDAAGNTSEFSANFTMPADTENCGPPLTWGDHNCSGAADPIDALLTLRHDAGLPAGTGECPEFGDAVSASGSALTWGDIDCDGTVGPVDGLKILRHDAGLPVQQEPDCSEIGEPIS
jgi:parallel beta-helix repeat protein